MLIKQYDISYLDDVAQNLGFMLEHSNVYKFSPTYIWERFIVSKVAIEIQRGNPTYLVGHSGHELLREIVDINGDLTNQTDCVQRSDLYWAGYALAHLQYETSLSFFKLNGFIPIDKVINLYPSFHKFDITKFIDYAKALIKEQHTSTNLKLIRNASGLSQKELAKMAKVDLRSIQMYEQRKNDINKAQAQTLYNISKILGCKMEDLLEY